MNKVYQFLIENLWLEDHHKENLIKERGFTQETITKFKFRSCGSYVKKLKETIIKEFSQEEIKDSHIFTKDFNFKPCLLKNNILIPYLDENGLPYYIRPHHDALSGSEFPVYHPFNLKYSQGAVLLTEGEFKAAAAMQYGITAISVPGINSFAGKKFPILVDFLKKHEVRQVIISFDNEVKDDPNLDSFIKNPDERYNTQFYSYYLAKKISKNKDYPVEALIADIPDSWRIRKGKEKEKIDIDGALAIGKTKTEMQDFLSKAKTYSQYLKDQPDKIRHVLLKKNQSTYTKQLIKEEFNCYVAFRQPAKGNIIPEKEVISNFVIRIVATYKTPKGIIRQIKFINQFGKESELFFIEGEDMIRQERFAEFCLSKGNYVWSGNKSDISIIWKQLFLSTPDTFIEEYDHIGYIKDIDAYLFENIAFVSGKPLSPDQNGIFWVGDKGVKPASLVVDKKDNAYGVPHISTEPIDFLELRHKLADTMGLNNANLALGWVISVLFMEEIFEKYRCFPFLFLFGKTMRGKSTIARWLMWSLGVEGEGQKIKDSTNVGIQRKLSYFSAYPVFMDDYRNLKDIAYKNEIFRSAYNREASLKGIRADFGLREAKVRGTLIFTGEDLPEDAALLSRNIYIQVTPRDNGINHFEWFREMGTRLSYLSYYVLTNKNKLLSDFFKNLEQYKKELTEKGINDRTALHFAIAYAGNRCIFEPDENQAFDCFIEERAITSQNDHEDEHVFNTFWEDIKYLITSEKIKCEDFFHTRAMDSRICIYFSGLYNEWMEDCRRKGKEVTIKKMAIKKQIQEDKNIHSINEVVLFLDGKSRRCIVLGTKKPVYLEDIVD